MPGTRISRGVVAGAVLAAALMLASCGGEGTAPDGSGRIALKLTDAPFPFDSVKTVDVFVVRIDAKQEDSDEAEAAESVDDASHGGWRTIATPNKSFDLLTLRGGTTANLGEASLPAGKYESFRIIIDVAQSSVTLKDGTVLNGGSTPGITFPSAGRSGLKIELDHDVVIDDGTTTLLIDFDVGSSFVLRGNSLMDKGLLFKPVIRATVTS
jgi:uncharacterized protein DUF4382